MSYYIKPTYPEGNNNASNVYFKSWIDNFKIIENYSNWTLTGDIYIYSNTYLPNYSFYMDIKTYLFQINNISLTWKEQFYNKMINNQKEQAFSIDKYVFRVDVNLNNSSIYNEEVINQTIPFSFAFSFNQNIFSDFDVLYNENDRNQFINQINTYFINYDYIFSNTFILDDEINDFRINNYSDNLISFNVPNFFMLSSPINKLLTITKNSMLKVNLRNIKLEMQYKLKETSEWFNYQETLKNIFFNDETYTLSLNNTYFYDESNNKITISLENQLPGIFIPKNTIGFINLEFELEYMNILRKVKFNRQFSFNEEYYNKCLRTILFSNLNESLNTYLEVYYGK